MYEHVHPRHCDVAGVLDLGELLRWADLATCAAAEAHTGANCVTVAVSDLAFEEGVVPRVGDSLEIAATPVVTGNTSLDIALFVRVEEVHAIVVRPLAALCSAHFTYVITPGPNGTKPRCPPLVLSTDEERHLALLAKERKSLLKKCPPVSKGLGKSCIARQGSTVSHGNNKTSKTGTVPMGKTVVRMTELVLPEHTNHMDNTFGGQVMAWMHKAASFAARRHVGTAGVPAVLRTRVVEAVEFHTPSKASDHLLFEAKVQFVQRPNRLVISVLVQKRVISEQSKITTINTGIFHMDAFKCDEVTRASVPSVAPDDGDQDAESLFSHISHRCELLASRAVMLGFRGGAMPWMDELAREAACQTIESMLWLLSSATWQPLAMKRGGFKVDEVNVHIAKDVWRQDKTAIKLSVVCRNVPGDRAFQLIMDCERRCEWDVLCTDFRIEENVCEGTDLVSLIMRVPTEVADRRRPLVLFVNLFPCACRKLQQSILTMLRAWRHEDGNYFIANRSIIHQRYNTATAEVQPSGWMISPQGPDCRITYVVQVENASLRRLLGTVDHVEPMARVVCKSVTHLRALLEAPDGKEA